MSSAVSREEFERLQEEVELLKESIGVLSNPELIEEIEEARRRRAEGNVVSLDDVEDELGE